MSSQPGPEATLERESLCRSWTMVKKMKIAILSVHLCSRYPAQSSRPGSELRPLCLNRHQRQRPRPNAPGDQRTEQVRDSVEHVLFAGQRGQQARHAVRWRSSGGGEQRSLWGRDRLQCKHRSASDRGEW